MGHPSPHWLCSLNPPAQHLAMFYCSLMACLLLPSEFQQWPRPRSLFTTELPKCTATCSGSPMTFQSMEWGRPWEASACHAAEALIPRIPSPLTSLLWGYAWDGSPHPKGTLAHLPASYGAMPGMGEKMIHILVWQKFSENALALCGNRYKPHFYAVFYILVVFENVLIFGNIKINNGICGI